MTIKNRLHHIAYLSCCPLYTAADLGFQTHRTHRTLHMDQIENTRVLNVRS